MTLIFDLLTLNVSYILWARIQPLHFEHPITILYARDTQKRARLVVWTRLHQSVSIILICICHFRTFFKNIVEIKNVKNVKTTAFY